MITDKIKEIINRHVDDYLDEMRFDFIWLNHYRDIQEMESGKFIVTDTDIIIDRSQNYDEILTHPIEDFFVPAKVNLYVTQVIVKLKLPQLVELSDFDDSGILQEEEIFIDDQRISDDQLIYLLGQTCFDTRYQELEPEVKTYLRGVYGKDHPKRIQDCLNRIRPFLRV